MEDTQDLIFEIEGNVGSVGSSDLLGVVSLVMTGGTEALHLGKTSDSFEQQTGKKAKTAGSRFAQIKNAQSTDDSRENIPPREGENRTAGRERGRHGKDEGK